MRGRAIWIKEDLTWNERKTIWRLRQIAWKEEAKGRRVWIGKGELKIEGKWWRWDEIREELRYEGGRRWETELGMVEKREIRRGEPGNEQQGEEEKGGRRGRLDQRRKEKRSRKGKGHERRGKGGVGGGGGKERRRKAIEEEREII